MIIDLLVTLVVLALLLAPLLLGADSRDGRDWQPRRDPGPPQPRR
jgi:hypothetical protein